VREGYRILARRFAQRYVTLDGTQEPEILVRDAAALVEARRAHK
jgi:thymidylate kinase